MPTKDELQTFDEWWGITSQEGFYTIHDVRNAYLAGQSLAIDAAAIVAEECASIHSIGIYSEQDDRHGAVIAAMIRGLKK